ncbi:MAG: carbonic anhydrase [Candidatus Pacebacteria bacterium]|nr:carbonic anhydrase [Candidatus Paceibacterota bacterium]
MCINCITLNRRQMLKATTIGVVALGLGIKAKRVLAKTGLTADEALAKLIAGNQKYVDSDRLDIDGLRQARASTAAEQSPFVSILTCSDSRLVPEFVFGGLELGELFVARDAGNVVDANIIGTIEYGVEHLGTPLVVVLGHSHCGAVKAACAYVQKPGELPGSIGKMIKDIIPIAKSQLGKEGDFIDNVVRENAKNSAKLLTQSPMIGPKVKSGKVKILAARYDLETGKVDFLG